MLVKDVMTTDVKTGDPEENIMEAAQRMTEFRVGCLVVVHEGKLEGIVTDSDILEKVVAADKKASEVLIKNIMTKKLIMIGENSDISDAVDIMEKSHIKKLPVISGKILVGILTAADLAQAQPKLVEKISSIMLFPKARKNVAG